MKFPSGNIGETEKKLWKEIEITFAVVIANVGNGLALNTEDPAKILDLFEMLDEAQRKIGEIVKEKCGG